MKHIDWDEIFFKVIFIFLSGDIYYRANSEIKKAEMELEIFEKKIDKDIYTSMVGKTLVTRTDKDYYIYCSDG